MTNEAANATPPKKQRLWEWTKRWANNPEWWGVIVGALQLIIGSGLIIVGGIFIQQYAQEAAVDQQISTFVVALRSEDPSKYEPATDGLTALRFKGKKTITEFAALAPQRSWRKAYFLYKRVQSFAQDDKARKNAFEMLWSTWLSHDFNFGSDVQLYEAIKNNPDLACPIVTRDLQKVRERSSFSETALVVALMKACPQQGGAEIKAYRSRLIDGLREVDGEINSRLFIPWLGEYRGETGPYEAQDLSFHEMVYGIRELFHEADRYNTLSAELTLQPLWVRIVFEGVIAFELTEKKTFTKDEKKRLLQLVNLGLYSTDRDARYAALAVIGNLAGRIPTLRKYKAVLLIMARKDEDPGLRETAYKVLVQSFSL